MADLLMKMPIPYEPKRQNRFILRFPSSLGINEWFVESSARPHIKIAPTEIQFLNTSTFVAGRFNWDPIPVLNSVTLLDRQRLKLLWSGFVYTLNQLQVVWVMLRVTKKTSTLKCWTQQELLLRNGFFMEHS